MIQLYYLSSRFGVKEMNNYNSQAFKSGIAYTIASFAAAGMSFVATPVFTRMLSQADFGAYNNFLSWQNVLGFIITLNLGATFISARVDYKDDFNSYVLSMLALCSLVVVLFGIAANIFAGTAEIIFDMKIGYINLMVLGILFSQFITVYQSKERFEFHYGKAVAASLGNSVSATFIAIFLVYKMQDKYCGRIVGMVAPTVAIGLFVFAVLLLQGRRVNISYWKYALPLCLPYIPHLLSLTLLNSMDRIMIRKIWGEREVALYSLAYTCSSVVTVLMSSMNIAYAPWLARKLEKKEYGGILKFSYMYVSAFIFLVVGILLVAPEALWILGGESYMEAKFVMPPVMLGCALQLLYTMHVNVEQYQKKTVGMATASACAAFINYLLNLWLIPKFGYIAAAYTTWFGYLFLLLAHMFLVFRLKLGRMYDERFMLLMALGGSIFMVLVNFIYGNDLLRYMLLLAYAGAFIFSAYRYKDKIRILLKM